MKHTLNSLIDCKSRANRQFKINTYDYRYINPLKVWEFWDLLFTDSSEFLIDQQ